MDLAALREKLPSAGTLGWFRRRRWRLRLEAAAERQVEVDALHALVGLYPDERGLRRIQRQLPLVHEPEIRAADLELGLDHLQRALIV